MKRALATICMLNAAATAAASPVERVVKLLEDLQGKLEMDEKKEQQVYDKYACWCEKTTERKATAIADAQADLRAFGQTILSLKGKVASLGAEVEQLTDAIKANGDATAEATSLRQKENEAYMAETGETKQALAALEKAIAVLVKATAPAEEGAAKEEGAALLQTAASAVRSAISALPARASLSGQQASLLSEFLQAGASARYSPQSMTVQGILKDMYDTFAADLESATRDEAGANSKFEDFVAIKAEELAALEAEKAKKEGQKADAEERLADTQQMYDDTTAQREADVVFFDETKAACETKHDEWTTRSSLREEEIAGISKALAILTPDDARALFASAIKPGEGVGASDEFEAGEDISFAQVGAEISTADVALRAYATLKQQARTAHSLRLALLAMRVRAAKVGHFDEVIASIDEMIKTLKEENAADIAKRDQCKEEYLKIESTSKDLRWKIKNNAAKIDKLGKLIELRTAQKERTIEEIADVEDHMSQLTAMREEENAAFLAAKKEDQGAIDLLMAARTALGAYYANRSVAMGEVQGSVKGAAALLQQPVFNVSADQAPEADFTGKGHRKGEAKGIVSILTMIIEDLDDEIKNGMKAEEEAQLEYESQMDAAKKLKEELVAKKVSLEEAIAKRGEEKEAESEDKAENQAALDDETEYKASIKADCDWILGAFEQRAAAREAELSGLAGAKDFLAGYRPAPQEASFLERGKAAPFDDAALAKVRFLGLRR